MEAFFHNSSSSVEQQNKLAQFVLSYGETIEIDVDKNENFTTYFAEEGRIVSRNMPAKDEGSPKGKSVILSKNGVKLRS